eukprot:SAG22_NODE_962_length_6280_cov_4.343472_5_plen_103_part_00
MYKIATSMAFMCAVLWCFACSTRSDLTKPGWIHMNSPNPYESPGGVRGGCPPISCQRCGASFILPKSLKAAPPDRSGTICLNIIIKFYCCQRSVRSGVARPR